MAHAVVPLLWARAAVEHEISSELGAVAIYAGGWECEQISAQLCEWQLCLAAVPRQNAQLITTDALRDPLRVLHYPGLKPEPGTLSG